MAEARKVIYDEEQAGLMLDGRINDDADGWAVGIAAALILLAAVLALLIGG